MAIYLKDARHIDWKSFEITRGHIEVGEGPDAGIRMVEAIPDGAESIDCKNKWVTRAFVVAHHHIYSELARGMPAPKKSPETFVEILQYVWWNLDKKLDADMIHASALACAIDAIRSGTSFIIDHHASPLAVEGSLHIIAEALEEVGLGHLLCYELSDRDGIEPRRQGLEETAAYLANRPGLVGLHASFTVSDRLLEEAVKLAERFDSGIHVHMAEAVSDETHCLGCHGTRVAERFAEAGVLGFPKTLLAHCIHLDDRERALVAGSPAWVVQNTESNQNNKVGTFTPEGLGDRILIGTDGMHSDAVASARAAFLAAAPGVSLQEVYARLTGVHRYLSSNLFPGDGGNNLVILDYEPPSPIHPGNWLGHLFYALSRAHVDGLICQGRPVMLERHILTVDEQAVMAHAREQAGRLWALL